MGRFVASMHLFSVLFSLCTLSPVASDGVANAARRTLVSLYNSTDGDNWRDNDNWLVGDPCINDWHGVYCDANDTQIEKL